MRGLLFLVLSFVNTAFFGSLIALLGCLALVRSLRPSILPYINLLAESWVWGNRTLLFSVIPEIDFDVRLPASLNYQGWYLLLPNHQSWVDIVLLFHVCYKRLPFLKFFLKYELLYVPFLGIACKGLNMPFMKRYSHAYLEKHPEKKGQDLEVTRRACATFLEQPAAVVNFMEGTRFTPAKQLQQNSPYRHLLRPRAGGVGYVMNTLNQRLDAVLDIVIVYPDGVPTLVDLACGRLKRVTIEAVVRSFPEHLQGGDYENDANYRSLFHQWIGQLWLEKDNRIDKLLKSHVVSHA